MFLRGYFVGFHETGRVPGGADVGLSSMPVLR